MDLRIPGRDLRSRLRLRSTPPPRLGTRDRSPGGRSSPGRSASRTRRRTLHPVRRMLRLGFGFAHRDERCVLVTGEHTITVTHRATSSRPPPSPLRVIHGRCRSHQLLRINSRALRERENQAAIHVAPKSVMNGDNRRTDSTIAPRRDTQLTERREITGTEEDPTQRIGSFTDQADRRLSRFPAGSGPVRR